MREHLVFVATRVMWLTAKCYLVPNQNKTRKNKYSCKGILKKHNDLYIEPYEDVLDVFQKKEWTLN